MKRVIYSGYKHNRARPGADRALQLAKMLVRHIGTSAIAA